MHHLCQAAHGNEDLEPTCLEHHLLQGDMAQSLLPSSAGSSPLFSSPADIKEFVSPDRNKGGGKAWPRENTLH